MLDLVDELDGGLGRAGEPCSGRARGGRRRCRGAALGRRRRVDAEQALEQAAASCSVMQAAS